jgi:flagellar protein FliS
MNQAYLKDNPQGPLANKGDYMTIREYEETAITTQDRGRIIVMLYDGAIKFLNQAVRALARSDFEAKGYYIIKAQDIVMELNAILDMEAGGLLAANLRQLYLFIWKRLNLANRQSNPHIIREAIDLLAELNRGWRAIAV